MSPWVVSLFAAGVEAISKKQADGRVAFGEVAKTVMRHPIKMLAAFFLAPFLAFRLAMTAKSPVRRAIAGMGVVFGVLAAWAAGTILGTLSGAFLIGSGFGLLWGLGFFIGTTLSMILSVTFSILAMNAVAYFFLQMSSEDVVEYLRGLSK